MSEETMEQLLQCIGANEYTHEAYKRDCVRLITEFAKHGVPPNKIHWIVSAHEYNHGTPLGDVADEWLENLAMAAAAGWLGPNCDKCHCPIDSHDKRGCTTYYETVDGATSCSCREVFETVTERRARIDKRLTAAKAEFEALQDECEHTFAKFLECQATRTPGYINEYMPAEVVVRWWQVSCSDCGKSWKEEW